MINFAKDENCSDVLPDEEDVISASGLAQLSCKNRKKGNMKA